MAGTKEDPVRIGPPKYLLEVSFARVEYCCFAVDLVGGSFQGQLGFSCSGPGTFAGDYNTNSPNYLLGGYITNYRIQYLNDVQNAASYTPGGAPLIFVWTKRQEWFTPVHNLFIPFPDFSFQTADYGNWQRGGGESVWDTGPAGINPDGLAIPLIGTGDSTPTFANGVDPQLTVNSLKTAGGGSPKCWEFSNPTQFHYGVDGASSGASQELQETYFMGGVIITYSVTPEVKLSFQCISSVFQPDQGPAPHGRLWFLAQRTDSL